MKASHRIRQRQRGVAVITALLLTTLAVTIVASLFWQQQVQVRSIENQRTQLQKQWILRGALDWSRLILRSNNNANGVDALSDPWAIPLQEVRLDDFVENGKQDAEASSATLSGFIVDAQARYNMNTLVRGGTASAPDVAAFARLLGNLRVSAPETLADAVAAYLVSAQPPSGTKTDHTGTARSPNPVTPASPTTPEVPTAQTDGTTKGAGGVGTAAGPHVMTLTQVDDLLAVDGFNSDVLQKIRDYVIVLPGNATMVNVNTASAEVLSAVVPGLSLGAANGLVSGRERAYFKDISDFNNHLPTKPDSTSGTSGAAPAPALDVKSQYFLVNGKVKLNNAVLEIQSLVRRPTPGGPVKSVWTREN